MGPKNKTKEDTLRSECGSALKKRLTGSALLEMTVNITESIAASFPKLTATF
jgi:hypothetical protein